MATKLLTQTQKVKARIIKSWFNSLTLSEKFSYLVAGSILDMDYYVLNSPDEIKEYEAQKELDRIKYSE